MPFLVFLLCILWMGKVYDVSGILSTAVSCILVNWSAICKLNFRHVHSKLRITTWRLLVAYSWLFQLVQTSVESFVFYNANSTISIFILILSTVLKITLSALIITILSYAVSSPVLTPYNSFFALKSNLIIIRLFSDFGLSVCQISFNSVR